MGQHLLLLVYSRYLAGCLCFAVWYLWENKTSFRLGKAFVLQL